MRHLFKSEKKWTLKIQKSKIVILVLKQSPISAVFQIVRFPGDQKIALTGESLYSERAKKLWQNLQILFDITYLVSSKEISLYVCGLLRLCMYEL